MLTIFAGVMRVSHGAGTLLLVGSFLAFSDLARALQGAGVFFGGQAVRYNVVRPFFPPMLPMSENTPARPMLYDPTEHRIRSFVTRAGRLSIAQARALEELGPKFLIEYAKAPLDFEQAFGRSAPVILEIGFGMGDTTSHIARGMPEKDFIGVEVHTPGVGSLLKQIGEQGLTNLRLIQHDAVEVLNQMIPDATTSAACCSRHSSSCWPGSWRREATCTAPPTGKTTPSRCSKYSAAKKPCRTPPTATPRSQLTAR